MSVMPAETATSAQRFHRLSLAPTGLVGTSFKHEHLPAILADSQTTAFFEVHAENYMGEGGPQHRVLQALRERATLSVHGVCMSLGGDEPLDDRHLERFRRLVERYEPALVSEHLAWSSRAGKFYNDLLPLPYTDASLAQVCTHVNRLQDTIGRSILIENPSTYVAFTSSTMHETEFLKAVVQRTGCGLLLDLNNVFVSATNHGYCPVAYLDSFPLADVGQIHLAGHAVQRDKYGGQLLIDSHDAPVSEAVWRLFEKVIAITGPLHTIVEWDSALPEWPVLRAQGEIAHRKMECVTLRSSVDYAT